MDVAVRKKALDFVGGERGLSPGNLPLRASSFVGRERELDEVRELLFSTRLLTLTGPGGCGKTRLALETAASVAESFEHGAFWVELAPLSDPAHVAESAARSLGARWRSGYSAMEALLDHLEDREALLVLDNCEHLISACATLSDALLRRCPGVKLLATSREALRIVGESAWLVPSLSLPDPGISHAPEELARHESVRLFAERASAVAPGFALSRENAAAVARICERLDGIPLAIELAAARSGLLPPAQIASRLDNSFLLLTGGSRVALPRHRTLRGTMDWSHDLLLEDEKTLFRRLAVFAGGFTLAAAEDVCSGSGIESGDVLELLSGLVEKSLIHASAKDAQARYHTLETVGQYASEKLEESGEGDALRDRHADFFLRMAERAEPELSGAHQREWMDVLDAEIGNLRAAMARLLEAGGPEAGLRLASALWEFCHARGHYGEGRTWLEAAILTSEGPPALRARALTGAGVLAFLQCEYARAGERLEESLSLYRELSDRRGVAEVTDILGSAAREQGNYERAVTLHEESLALWRELGDEQGIAGSLDYLGFVAWLRGEHDRAGELCAKALEMSRASGDVSRVISSLVNLGSATLYGGDHARARDLLGESLALAREGSYKEGIGWSLNQLGVAARREGDHERASALLRESLGVHRDLGDRWRSASVVEALAGISREQRNPERAARLFGGADALRERTGTPLPPCERPDYERGVAGARAAMGEKAFERAREQGASLALGELFDYALEPGEQDDSVATEAAPTELSAREAEVLGLVAEGLTDPEVARKLYLSPRTVSQHLRSVYRKLGVSSRAAATRAALERGLV